MIDFQIVTASMRARVCVVLYWAKICRHTQAHTYARTHTHTHARVGVWETGTNTHKDNKIVTNTIINILQYLKE